MPAHNVWNLMYVLGNTGRVTGDADNPQRRSKALDGAAVITTNSGTSGWRCWVEHKDTGKRIFESPAELAHRQAQETKQVIRFGEGNAPGFRTKTENDRIAAQGTKCSMHRR